MQTIIVLDNQSLLDIAIRYCGTVEAVVAIAVLNNVSVTAELVPGKILQVPEQDYGYREIVAYYQDNKLQPATGLTDQDKAIIRGRSGIGYWAIGVDFIVQ